MTAEFKKCWMLKIYTGEDVIVGNDPLYRRSPPFKDRRRYRH